MNYKKLSKFLSLTLRHQPEILDLKLDEEGWTPIEPLLEKLSHRDRNWKNLTQADLEKMIELSEKKRHEISDGRIRCLYGHSIEKKIVKESIAPPEILFHGTARETARLILAEGLKPMNRQYVHLSEDIETAGIVGKRKDREPVILKIEAGKAARSGIAFYHGNEKIWLAEPIPARFILEN